MDNEDNKNEEIKIGKSSGIITPLKGTHIENKMNTPFIKVISE
jgi:hypothetical protein